MGAARRFAWRGACPGDHSAPSVSEPCRCSSASDRRLGAVSGSKQQASARQSNQPSAVRDQPSVPCPVPNRLAGPTGVTKAGNKNIAEIGTSSLAACARRVAAWSAA